LSGGDHEATLDHARADVELVEQLHRPIGGMDGCVYHLAAQVEHGHLTEGTSEPAERAPSSTDDPYVVERFDPHQGGPPQGVMCRHPCVRPVSIRSGA
jgi:hypothetical protein